MPAERIEPPPDVKAEFEELLRDDQTRLGDVFRGLESDQDAEQIREALGVATQGFVFNYRSMIRALLDGDLPEAPSMAAQTARKFRSILKTADLSGDARSVLSKNLEVLEERVSDPAGQDREITKARAKTARIVERGETGIYVYTLPHYLRYPYDEDSERTLLKVGRSDRDVIERFRHQTRTTALPEEPMLLRVYEVGDGEAEAVEMKFHRLLRAADFYQRGTKSAGREWFLTKLQFLDEIASVLELPIVEVVVDDGDVE